MSFVDELVVENECSWVELAENFLWIIGDLKKAERELEVDHVGERAEK